VKVPVAGAVQNQAALVLSLKNAAELAAAFFYWTCGGKSENQSKATILPCARRPKKDIPGEPLHNRPMNKLAQHSGGGHAAD